MIGMGELCCDAFPDWCRYCSSSSRRCELSQSLHRWNLGNVLDQERLNDSQRPITAARKMNHGDAELPGRSNRSIAQPRLRWFRRLRPERSLLQIWGPSQERFDNPSRSQCHIQWSTSMRKRWCCHRVTTVRTSVQVEVRFRRWFRCPPLWQAGWPRTRATSRASSSKLSLTLPHFSDKTPAAASGSGPAIPDKECRLGVWRRCQNSSHSGKLHRPSLEFVRDGLSSEQRKWTDGKWMIPNYGRETEKAICVPFFNLQPGVVPRCDVTERIPFVNIFCSVQERRFGICLDFPLLDQIWGTLRKVCGSRDCCFVAQSLVCHFLENSTLALLSTLKVFLILHISDKRWLPALVLHCGSEAAPFPRTARLNWLVVSTDLNTSGRKSAATFDH